MQIFQATPAKHEKVIFKLVSVTLVYRPSTIPDKLDSKFTKKTFLQITLANQLQQYAFNGRTDLKLYYALFIYTLETKESIGKHFFNYSYFSENLPHRSEILQNVTQCTIMWGSKLNGMFDYNTISMSILHFFHMSILNDMILLLLFEFLVDFSKQSKMRVIHFHDCMAVSGNQKSCCWDFIGLLLTDLNPTALRKDKIL